MNGDYSIFNASMNGVITLSDGVSSISDGVAQHDAVIYSDYIQSKDGTTTLTNDSLTTQTVNADWVDAQTISANSETVGVLTCTTLNVDAYGFYVDGFANTISSSLPTTMNNPLSVVGNTLTLDNANLDQIGTTATNNLKTTSINGSLTCQSDLIQTGGNTQLKNVSCDNITMSANKSITQSGAGVSNSLGTTTVSNLVVSTSMSFPAEITIPAAEQTGDLTFTGGARIIQDLSEAGTNYNTLMFSKIAEAEVNGDLVQTSGSSTLLNTVIQGTAEIQGDITQTAGQSVFKAIGCDQLTLNANKDIFFSLGTGKIDQSVSTGVNTLNGTTIKAGQNLTQSGTGILSQSGTGTNALKNTAITGTLAVSSSSTLTGNVSIGGTLTMSANRSITQPLGTTANQFQTTSISDLTCPTATVVDLTATTLSVGNVSNTEIQYLDGVVAPIQSQLDNLQATASGTASSTTGITYTTGTDTTTISNNLVIPTGKTFQLGAVSNVETNLATLNSAVSTLDADLDTLTAAYSSTTSGMAYNLASDTTSFDNNVSISKALVVQGMDVKAEIDALETSFTTGTINSTSATIATLNSTTLNTTNMIATNIARAAFFVSVNPTSGQQSVLYQQNSPVMTYDNQAPGSSHLFATYSPVGTQVLPLVLSYASAVFGVAVSVASLTITSLATVAAAVITTLTATTITSPTDANLSIMTASGRALRLNCDKGAGTGDVRINTSSPGSNVYIDEGSLTVQNGTIYAPNGGFSTNSTLTGTLQTAFILPYPLTTSIRLQTSIRADADCVISSPYTYFGAWFIDAGPTTYKLDRFRPIPCSVAVAGGTDDYWIVAPGYRIVLYRYANYAILAGGRPWSGGSDLAAQTRTLDNTNGDTFLSRSSSDIYGGTNQVGSCKLYFKTQELTMSYLS